MTTRTAPRIHGELQKLGFVVSERTVARYLRGLRLRGDAGRRWLAFLENHREAILAFDFFTVPTLMFQRLYCFFVIEHRRRKILHCNVTRHPTADWLVQQLRETLPEAGPDRYVIFGRDSAFNDEVVAFLKAAGLKAKRTSIRAPWQNGTAERWIGSIRRELLDHVIALSQRHLLRLMTAYVTYYHHDWVHDALGEGRTASAAGRTEANCECGGGRVASLGRFAPPLYLARSSISPACLCPSQKSPPKHLLAEIAMEEGAMPRTPDVHGLLTSPRSEVAIYDRPCCLS